MAGGEAATLREPVRLPPGHGTQAAGATAKGRQVWHLHVTPHLLPLACTAPGRKALPSAMTTRSR